jgi:allophanate hydrolase subunit 1
MASDYPMIRDVGLTGMLVTFADTLAEPANRAALAFRGAVEAARWEGVEETATSLTSAFVRFDPLRLPHGELSSRLGDLLARKDWAAEPLPPGRRRWRIPVALGGAEGPQFDEAAEAAGLSPGAAAEQIAGAAVRVLTIGFAPGQAYMGQLPAAWDIPRLKELTPRVPAGALVCAIRQLIVFTGPTPTGWRHIGQTAFRSFRPGTRRPFPLTPGDEVGFAPVPAAELARLRDADETGDGGASWEEIR